MDMQTLLNQAAHRGAKAGLGVLSACELSSEAQRAAIHQAVMDFTLAFMSSLAGRERERERERERGVGEKKKSCEE